MIIKKIIILIFGCLIFKSFYSQCPTSCIQSNLSLNCNNNIFCDPATAVPNDVYTNNVRSVIRIKNSDGETGTGTLLRQLYGGDDDNQQQNIIITARHVIHSGSAGFGPLTDLSQMEFYFNYSNPDCNNQPNVVCKTCRYVLKGATLIDENLLTDIAVLKLNDAIPPHFQPYYSGWHAIVPAISGTFFDIHHPSGDIKKISSTNALLVGNFPPTRYHIFWNDGVIESGSSGSGLFNFNRRLIGILSGGGGSNCTTGLSCNFGKFRNFWLVSPSTRSALRPNNNNNPFIVGNSGGEITCYAGPIYLDGIYWPAGDYQPTNLITIKCDGDMFLAQPTKPLTVKNGAEFSFEAGGNVITALPGFTAENGSEVSIKPNIACTAMRMGNTYDENDIDSSIVNYYYDEKKGELPKEELNIMASFSTLELFPNPSKGNFKIKSLIYTTDAYSYELIDVTGKILYSINANYFDNGETEIFNFNELLPGVYMFKIINENSKKTEYKRIIIQK